MAGSRKDACIAVGDKLVCGTQIEMGNRDFDWYQRKLLDFVCDHIDQDVVDAGLVKIRELETYEGLSTFVVDVGRSPRKRYLREKDFYVRAGNATEKREGAAIDQFWETRQAVS